MNKPKKNDLTGVYFHIIALYALLIVTLLVCILAS